MKVYMVIKGHDVRGTQGAHPVSPQHNHSSYALIKYKIHLHGHDFAILQQNEVDAFPGNLNLKTDNPPRRDVVLLPSGGYVVLAFKTDNPGTWLVHCHIARHAGEGLAMQIMERQKSAAAMWRRRGVGSGMSGGITARIGGRRQVRREVLVSSAVRLRRRILEFEGY
jgi:hypothetical protein